MWQRNPRQWLAHTGSAEVWRHAKLVIADTLAAIVAGSGEEEVRRLYEIARRTGGEGPCVAFGLGGGLTPEWAAMVNGVSGCSLELDEGHRFAGGHPAVHIIPAQIAVAQTTGAGGRRLLEGLVLGYEAAVELGRGCRLAPDVHPHGTWPVAGAAVACAWAAEAAIDLSQLLELAGCLIMAPPFVAATEGARVRNLYAGMGARQAITAFRCYESGFRGLADGAGRKVVFGRILGAASPERADYGSGAPAIMGNYFKMLACCRLLHGAVEAADFLQKEYSLRSEEIEAVEVSTFPAAARLAGANPRNSLAARFSLPYAVAVSLIQGADALTRERWFDPEDAAASELAGRVRVVVDPGFFSVAPGMRPSRVRVLLKGGGAVQSTVELPRGEPETRYQDSVLRGKFFRLTCPVLGEEKSRRLLATIDEMETMETVDHLADLLVP